MIKLNDILRTTTVTQVVGNSANDICQMKSLDDPSFSATDLAWCSDNNFALLKEVHAGFVLVSSDTFAKIAPHDNVTYLLVPAPRKAFQAILNHFFAEKKTFGSIANSAAIDESVIYNPLHVNIGPNVVIEKGVVIGENVNISANTVLMSHTVIHDWVSIGCNCTIGGVGFGYEANEDGEYELIPHIGNVILGKGVEIGNNVCIDKAVLGSTVLQENVKVDNLVHIAHGVHIGKNSLVIAHAMIAGSVKIGENVWVAPSSSIRQKLTVGNHATIGMGAVVVKNVKDQEVVAGNPAIVFPKK